MNDKRQIIPHKGGRTADIHVRVTPETRQKLEQIAEQTDQNLSDAITTIIGEYMNNEWHVLIRDEEYQIVSTTPGNDPLYGNGSWDHFSGPFATWEEAEDSVPAE